MKSSHLQETAAMINRDYPELRANIIEAADRALEGRHRLPGTGGKPLQLPYPLPWKDNPTPDDEFLWALNRHFHWVQLGRAALLTGEEKYSRRLVEEWLDWIEVCRPPDYVGSQEEYDFDIWGAQPWRLLEIGIRNYDSWPDAWELLTVMGRLPPELGERIAGSVREQAQVLAQWSPQTWPNADHNHLLMEMLGLYTASLQFPQFPEAEEWRRLSVHQLDRCFAVQFTAEGGQVEGCPHYHNHCVVLLCRAILSARRSGAEVPASWMATLDTAVNYSLQCTRPDGRGIPWGDSDVDMHPLNACIWACLAGSEEALSALQTLGGLVGPEALRRSCEGHLWLIPEFEAFMTRALETPRNAPLTFGWFRELDQASIRGAWSRDTLCLFAGCHSPVNNTHAHIDPGAFEFSALGKTLLVDPGRLTYRESPERYEFKRAASHNMLLVDDADPFEYVQSWRYGPQQEGRILAMDMFAGGLGRIVAEHHNYRPAVHRRTFFVLGEVAVVLVDQLRGLRAEQTVHLYFHVDSETTAWQAEQSRGLTADRDANLLIQSAPGLTGEVLPGRISEVIDVTRPSTRLHLRDAGGPASRLYVTVLLPFRAGDVPSDAAEVLAESAAPGEIHIKLANHGASISLPLLPFGDV